VDDHTRERLWLVADTSRSGRRVVRELDAVIARRSQPLNLVSDNGTGSPEWRSLRWSRPADGLAPHRCRQAMQNSFIESINGSFRDECLNKTLFSSLPEARHRMSAWKELQQPSTAFLAGQFHAQRVSHQTGPGKLAA
jgi:putative transposase